MKVQNNQIQIKFRGEKPQCSNLKEVEQAKDLMEFRSQFTELQQAIAKKDQGPDDWAKGNKDLVVLKDDFDCGPLQMDAELKKTGEFRAVRVNRNGELSHTLTPGGDKYELIEPSRIGNRVQTLVCDDKAKTWTYEAKDMPRDMASSSNEGRTASKSDAGQALISIDPPTWARPHCATIEEATVAKAKEESFETASRQHDEIASFVSEFTDLQGQVVALDQTAQDWAGDKKGLVVLQNCQLEDAVVDAELQPNGEFLITDQQNAKKPTSYSHRLTPHGYEYEMRGPNAGHSGEVIQTLVADTKAGTWNYSEKAGKAYQTKPADEWYQAGRFNDGPSNY